MAQSLLIVLKTLLPANIQPIHKNQNNKFHTQWEEKLRPRSRLSAV